MKPLRVGLIGYEGVQALDLFGPADAFSIAEVGPKRGETESAYELVVLAPTKRPFRTEAGVRCEPHAAFDDAPPLDTLIVPGGKGSRVERIVIPIAEWISKEAQRIRQIASVCTGIYILARTGLLDGRRVTTHWRFASDVAGKFPKLNVDDNALFLKDGKFYTAGGITAGIDLSLALIEEDCGPQVALSVACDLVVDVKRPGGQKQFSGPAQLH